MHDVYIKTDVGGTSSVDHQRRRRRRRDTGGGQRRGRDVGPRWAALQVSSMTVAGALT